MHNAVVFGASGFIGTHLVNRLAMSGVKTVAVMRKPPNSDKANQFAQPNIEIKIGDITDDSFLANILAKDQYVFNLATPSTPYTSANAPVVEIEEHILPQVKMLLMASKIGVAKMIYFSSGGGIYGKDVQSPISEHEVISPSSPHAIAKAAIEFYMQYFGSKYNIPQLIYRLSNPYGPGQVQKLGFGLIPTLFSHCLDNIPPQLYGEGNSIRDFIYIDDLIDAIMCSYDKKNQHVVYNVGSGMGTKTIEVWKIIKQLTNSSVEPQLLPKREFDVDKYILDVSRFSNEFGWNQKTSLVDGLTMTWNSLHS